MASSVFYKFKAQKTESRINFDGTGISVFDLKKDIILANNFGKATDFDLLLFDNANKEYKEDSQVIPRSSSVIAKRMPPSKPGRGRAAHYVAGAAPVRQENKPNAASSSTNWAKPGAGAMSKRFDGKEDRPYGAANTIPTGKTEAGSAETPVSSNVEAEEAERIKAMFAANDEVWEETQERMSHAQPVFRGGAPGRKPFHSSTPHMPDSRPVPLGYVCHRCGQKGHWIQDCPTNDDRNYDDRPRIKRTTGIPRSFLKTVETGAEGPPSGVMVTSDGEMVIVQPDVASWEKQRARVAPLTANDIREKHPPPSDPSLACPICKKLLRDAVKTPCCGKAFDEECLQSHLLENEFTCFSCHKKIASLDLLVADRAARERVRKYVEDEITKSELSGRRDSPAVEAKPEGEKLATETDAKPTLSAGDDEDDVYESQPGNAATIGEPVPGSIQAEINATQAQLNQLMVWMRSPPNPAMLMQMQMQFQELTMHLGQVQQLAVVYGSADVPYNPGDEMAMNAMKMMAEMSNMAGSTGFDAGQDGQSFAQMNGQRVGLHNPGLMNDNDSPYQRVALNDRRRVQKRGAPSDFDAADGQKIPRYYE